jgi:DNA-binding transcriptional LysR family regulator
MKHILPPLDSLKAFESAARHLSFSLAADELCITKGAVSYQIRKLEEQLQCRLFKRAVRQVYLTDAGQTLHHTTQRLFQELSDTLSQLTGENQQAGVSIAATTYVAARWLSSRIGQFNERYPDIAIYLHHSVNSADFKLGEVDLAIRWGPCKDRVDRNRFGEIPMAMFPAASPLMLERYGVNTAKLFTATQLLEAPFNQMTLLCEDRPQDTWQEWFDASAPESVRLENPRRVISDANVRVQAAVDGQGLILSDELMRNELNNGLLATPFLEVLEGYGYALMCSPTQILGGNAQLVKEWFSGH